MFMTGLFDGLQLWVLVCSSGGSVVFLATAWMPACIEVWFVVPTRVRARRDPVVFIYSCLVYLPCLIRELGTTRLLISAMLVASTSRIPSQMNIVHHVSVYSMCRVHIVAQSS